MENINNSSSIIGIWQGAYRIGENPALKGYTIIFKNNGKMVVFNGIDLLKSLKATGKYTFENKVLYGEYNYPNEQTLVINAVLDDKTSIIEGTWGTKEIVEGKFHLESISTPEEIETSSAENKATSNKNLLIKNPTALVLEVYYSPSDDKSETLLSQLYPENEVEVDKYGSYIFKTVNTKKIVDRFDHVSGMSDQYLIKFKKPDTSVANKVSVLNESNMDVSVEKIDFYGNFRFVAKLAPGEKYQGMAFLEEPHILRDLHSGAVVDFFYARYMDENRNRFNSYTLDNLTRGKATTVRFVNCEDKEIRLLNKIEKGWREIAKLGIGQIYECHTHSGQIWEFAIPQGGTLVETYYFIPSSDEFQSESIINKKKGNEVSFKNQTHFTLKAYKLIGGKRNFFGFIPPQAIMTRYSYMNSNWEFTALIGEEETTTIHSQNVVGAGLYQLTGNLLSKLIQNEDEVRKVKLTNQTSVRIKVQKNLDELSTEDLGEIAISEELDFECIVGTVLNIRDINDSSKIAQIIVPTGEDVFNYSVEIKSLHDRNPSKLTVNNHTNLVLDLIWLNYSGEEVKYSDIQSGGTILMNTFLTHPWLVKESRSGRIMKRVYGLEQDEVADINAIDIAKVEFPKEVEIRFGNTLPFTVDLYEVISNREEGFIGTIPEGEEMVMNNKTSAPVRIKEHASQEVVDVYIPSTTDSQQFEIQHCAVLGAEDADVEIFNLSFFDIDVYTFDSDGQQSKIGTVDTRMSEKVKNAKVGQSFILQEKKSAKIVGYFLATEKPLRYEFSGSDLRSATSSVGEKVISFNNKSNYNGTLYLIDYDGKKVNKGTLNANSSVLVQDARSGDVYVFTENASEIILDHIIVGDDAIGVVDLLPYPVSKTKRTHNELWPGEVAMFTEENYQGKSFIFHADLYSVLNEINDKVRSIKLGSGTALTVFQHTLYKGTNDVYHLDMPTLSDTDVKLELSSFQISYVTPESTSGISAISRLTEEPIVDADTNISNIRNRPVYRTTISFPITVSAVEVYTTEESTFEVRGKKYTTDPVKCAQITLGDNKQLVITTEANGLEQAIFMVRANTMRANERFFVFQDTELYKKILNMEKGSLAKNRTKLGIESTLSNSELDGVQAALQNLAATIPSVHSTKTHGRKQDLYAIADNMDYNSWGLSFGSSGTQAHFRPLSPEDVFIATKQGDNSVVRRDLDQEAAQWFWEDIPNPVSLVLEKVADTANTVVDAAKKAAETAARLAKEAAETAARAAQAVAETAARAAQEAAETTARLAKEAAETAARAALEAAEIAAKVAQAAAGEAKNVAYDVVDTAQTGASTLVGIAGGTVSLADQAIDKGISLVNDAAETVVSSASNLGGFVVDGASLVAGTVSAIPSVVKEVAIAATDAVSAAGKTVLKATIDLGSTIVELTLDTVDKVKSCIEMIVNKVFSAIKSVIDFFKDLFAWNDILDTKDMIADFFNGILHTIINDTLPTLETKIDGIFKYLEDSVIGKLDELIDNFSSDFKDQDDEPTFFDEAKDKINWFLDKFFGADDDNTASTNYQGSNNMASDNIPVPKSEKEATILSVLGELKDKLADIIQKNGKIAVGAFLDGIENITKAITGNGNPLKRIVVGVLSLVKSLASIGFGILKGLSTLLFKLIKLIFVFFKDLLNATVKVPFISNLYKILTGNELSALDLIALVCAAPTTVLSKLFYGKAPRALESPAGQSSENSSQDPPKGVSLSTPIISIVYASLTLIYAFVDPIVSAKQYFSEGDVFKQIDKVKVLDSVKCGISVMLLLFPIATEVLNQISRNYRHESAFADWLGWGLFALTALAVLANVVPLMVSLLSSNPLSDIIDDIGKGITALLAIITIPVYIVFQVASKKDESRDNDVLKVAAGVALLVNILEIGKIKTVKKLEPATASAIFISVLGIQTVLNIGVGTLAITGQSISI